MRRGRDSPIGMPAAEPPEAVTPQRFFTLGCCAQDRRIQLFYFGKVNKN